MGRGHHFTRPCPALSLWPPAVIITVITTLKPGLAPVPSMAGVAASRPTMLG